MSSGPSGSCRRGPPLPAAPSVDIALLNPPRRLQCACTVGRNGKLRWQPPQVPRGDLACTFLYKGFDEVQRLGLRLETQRLVRLAVAGNTHNTGMLVVDSIVPGGPADRRLEVGDVLVRVNGAICNDFLSLEDALDAHVGRPVRLLVERKGQPVDLEVSVQDLHVATPRTFLEFGGGSVHPLSYQQARNFASNLSQVGTGALPAGRWHEAGSVRFFFSRPRWVASSRRSMLRSPGTS